MAAALLGRELVGSLVPAVAPVVRQLLGPSLVVMGLLLLGVVRLDFVVGQRVSFWVEDHTGRQGMRKAFLLGVAFGLSFCPTLFLLFSGYLIPLSVRSPLGLTYPAGFAAGASIPLVALVGASTLGRDRFGRSVAAVLRADRRISKVAGAVIVLVGLNDTLLYWFL